MYAQCDIFRRFLGGLDSVSSEMIISEELIPSNAELAFVENSSIVLHKHLTDFQGIYSNTQPRREVASLSSLLATMKFATLVVLTSSLISVTLAHTTVWGVWVNGVDQGDGRNQYVRTLDPLPRWGER